MWTSPFLPGELREPGGRERSARDWVVDAAILLFALGLSALALADTWQQHSSDALFVDLLLGLVSFVSLWWRRRYPVAVGVITGLTGIVSAAAAGPGAIGLFNAVIRAPRKAVVAIAALALVNVTVYPLIYPGSEAYAFQLVLGVLVVVVVVGWGLFVRARRELIHSLRERAVRAESLAREAERRRIAREMHDVLAHRVTLLALHAGALEFRPDAPPEEIAHAAGVVRESANTALRELREVIGVLREGSEDGTERPQPTLSDIPALVDESRAAGMKVSCWIDADGEVPDGVGRTAYRIVQEGLTNARKHAPGAAVTVAIDSDPGRRLSVRVTSRGLVRDDPPPPGAGTGLIGLSERVALAGGELRHGRDEAGDFVLHATLPWSGS